MKSSCFFAACIKADLLLEAVVILTHVTLEYVFLSLLFCLSQGSFTFHFVFIIIISSFSPISTYFLFTNIIIINLLHATCPFNFNIVSTTNFQHLLPYQNTRNIQMNSSSAVCRWDVIILLLNVVKCKDRNIGQEGKNLWGLMLKRREISDEMSAYKSAGISSSF